MSVKIISDETINHKNYKNIFTSCIILTADKKILLQQRDDDFYTFPGYLSAFGGKVQQGELALDAIVREIQEELGVNILSTELQRLGVLTESITDHTELVYQYFWHDKNNKISGCFEGKPAYFDSIEEILAQEKVMDDVRWSIQVCREKGLLL